MQVGWYPIMHKGKQRVGSKVVHTPQSTFKHVPVGDDRYVALARLIKGFFDRSIDDGRGGPKNVEGAFQRYAMTWLQEKVNQGYISKASANKIAQNQDSWMFALEQVH